MPLKSRKEQVMQKLYHMLINGLKGALIILMLVVICSVTWGVFSRYVLQSAADWTGELSGYSLAWITFLGSGYAIFKKTHIRFESLVEVLPKPIKMFIETLFNLAMMFFVTVIMFYGGRLMMNAMGDQTLSLPVSKGVIYFVLPLGGTIMLIGFLIELVQVYTKKQLINQALDPLDKIDKAM